LKPGVTFLAITVFIVACGVKDPPTPSSEPTPQPKTVPTATVDLPTPGPTPTRVPIGVIEEDRAGLYSPDEPEERSPWGDDPQPDDDGVYRFVVGGKVTQPILIDNPPWFQEEFKEKQVRMGSIVAETVIQADGTVGNVNLLRGVDPDIDRAFLKSLKGYTFEPATLDGNPVPVRYILTLRIHPQ